jgi:hypothetical protein
VACGPHFSFPVPQDMAKGEVMLWSLRKDLCSLVGQMLSVTMNVHVALGQSYQTECPLCVRHCSAQWRSFIAQNEKDL